MNQALLTELQGLRAFPSVTLLLTTEPGGSMRPADTTTLLGLVDEADRRLQMDVDDTVREPLVDTLRRLATSASVERCTKGVAICASPDHEAIVRLGRHVRTRVVVDHTFATRDMVADANRTATFRVVTISEGTARLLVGDRDRLAEVQDWHWPLVRPDEDGAGGWSRRLGAALGRERRSFAVPTVLAGVTHTIRELVDEEAIDAIGVVPGNHDATTARRLHELAWPLVDEWLGRDGRHALARLDRARGARMFAGGIDEVWDLANDGRVELLVVEDDYHLAARVAGRHLEPATDLEATDVMDDVVDELIEIVRRAGGEAIMVAPGELAERGRLAAVLRY